MNFENFDFSKVTEFEWDGGNLEKNKKKHGLDRWLIEEIFFNEPLMIYEDLKHSLAENRWFALGKTDTNLMLMVVFTVRNNLIRIISARKMNKKERAFYENIQGNTGIS